MASENILKQKEEEVKVLAEKVKGAKLVLLTDYRGISVEDVTGLRNTLRDTKSEYKVIKNNIIKRALDKNGENGLDSVLEGPTAMIISEEDYLDPLKAIYQFSKKNEYYKIKGGIIEGKLMSAEDLITLAKLPSRQELLGMLAGALLGNISKLAVGLDQVRIQKEANA
ncbi:MAG: 50S ribosomal protein L10 [Clostridiaceae bacterium]|nr:50S ribosomal protein L10 [Clostridiaceae bacterium]